ncbi:MAG: ribonuclease HI family protein [Bacillota bacterium]
MRTIMYIDGASRGNPGPASCAAVILSEGVPEREIGLFIGTTTNNVAEYAALILGLQEAKDLGSEEVVIFSDSNLCVQQIKGEFKVSSPHLSPLHKKAMDLLKSFSHWEIHHIPREKNERADSLTDRILDLERLISKELNS